MFVRVKKLSLVGGNNLSEFIQRLLKNNNDRFCCSVFQLTGRHKKHPLYAINKSTIFIGKPAWKLSNFSFI